MRKIRKFILTNLVSYEWGYYIVRRKIIKWWEKQNRTDDILPVLIALRKMYLSKNGSIKST